MEVELDLQTLKVGYMINPDKVYYNEMDDYIIKHLEERGAIVEKFNIEDIHFSMKSNVGVEVFIKNKKINWDGFLSYGYMSKFHYEAYMYIVSGLETAGIMTLHTLDQERILNNKFEQSLKFVKNGINIPDTEMGFSISTFKWIANQNYKEKSIIKKLDDYGGDGVTRCDSHEHLVNHASKVLWRNEYCLFQKYIPDSEGRSIRVLCINSKSAAIAEYIDKSNNFKSNNSFGDNFIMKSLMNDKNYDKYAKIAQSAVKSIGDLVIAGVDILDSNKHGCVVLEVNGWPDIYDIIQETKLDLFDIFADAYLLNCASFKLRNSNGFLNL